jgi:uncharacterized protein DUF6525
MRAYEKLPPTLRQALRDAAFNYAPQPILTRWRRGMSVNTLVKQIEESDRDLIARSRKREGRS